MNDKLEVIILFTISILLGVVLERYSIPVFVIIGVAYFFSRETLLALLFYIVLTVVISLNNGMGVGYSLLAFTIGVLLVQLLYRRLLKSESWITRFLKFVSGLILVLVLESIFQSLYVLGNVHIKSTVLNSNFIYWIVTSSILYVFFSLIHKDSGIRQSPVLQS